jgi:beta-lactamase superfamily II metal-dependent hydrolase
VNFSRLDPPNPHELEISVIGPGRGECILVHLGDNDWCVVDSCTARTLNEPVAIEYLRSFNNDAHNRVKLVVATHWHDDHIRGLAKMLEAFPNAQFACSAALDTDNFALLLGVAEESLQETSGVDEFRRIRDLLIERGRSTGTAKSLISPVLAIQNRCLLRLPAEGRSFPAAVISVSPSDGTVKKAFADIADWLPKSGELQRRIPNRAPNKTSVGLWIEAASRRVLLGADLEHTEQLGEGWIAVIASHQDDRLAGIFKVPHHGSQNADCPEVWPKMLSKNPVSVVTPFTSGTGLPTAKDIRRLAQRTSALFCTAQGPGAPPRRDSVVERTARSTTQKRHVLSGSPGHVRVRWSANDEDSKPNVQCFNGAYQVQ